MKKTSIRLLGLGLLLGLLLPAGAQAQFTFTTNADNTLTITGYTEVNPEVVVIPDTIYDLPVTSIGSWAFSACYSLLSVTIPNSVTNIGYAAFFVATSLTNVIIPDSVISIGDSAFSSCCSLTNLQIPNSVTSIGSNSFMFCNSLTEVTIPNAVTNLGEAAFSSCSSLMNIMVATNNPNYTSVSGVLFDKNQTTILQCPGGKQGSYSVPDGIANIGYMAFAGCASLTNITISAGGKTIGNRAFMSCTNLITVTIPDSVTKIEDYAFASCYKLASVVIPDSLTNMGNSTFHYCYRLVSARIGTNVTDIGDLVFVGCSSLASLTISGNVTNIGIWAFANCSSLRSVYFQGNAPSLAVAPLFPNTNNNSAFFAHTNLFYGANSAVSYYLPGTTNWGAMFGGRPTALWLPQAQASDASFGVRTNQFGFNVSWASGQTVVVEACADLAAAVWTPLQTNTLTGDSFYFSDPQWTNHPARLYRLCTP